MSAAILKETFKLISQQSPKPSAVRFQITSQRIGFDKGKHQEGPVTFATKAKNAGANISCSGMVTQQGLEPMTPALKGRCSTN